MKAREVAVLLMENPDRSVVIDLGEEFLDIVSVEESDPAGLMILRCVRGHGAFVDRVRAWMANPPFDKDQDYSYARGARNESNKV